VLVVADHQNKADVGVAIARQWYDARGVKAIFDITNSAVGLAIQELAKSRNRLVVFDSAGSSDFTGKACSPNGIQWNADTWSSSVPLVRLLIKQNLDSFFFITADYAFGASLEADARDAIAKSGGSVVGGVRSPLNTADFSSYLIAAQASKAKSHRVRASRRRPIQRAQTSPRVQSRRGAISGGPNHLVERRQCPGP
jgi:branched-chain amino acid transport system substrate-binding protein